MASDSVRGNQMLPSLCLYARTYAPLLFDASVKGFFASKGITPYSVKQLRVRLPRTGQGRKETNRRGNSPKGTQRGDRPMAQGAKAE